MRARTSCAAALVMTRSPAERRQTASTEVLELTRPPTSIPLREILGRTYRSNSGQWAEPFQGERFRSTVKVLFNGTSNCVSYNATTGIFQYNLKTASSLAPGDYTISVKVPAQVRSGKLNA
jgi:hypothetical protein